MTDEIQRVIAARAETLGLTTYAVAKATGEDGPSEDTVRRYLDGKCALNSRYVSAICDVLDLELRSKPKPRSRSRQRTDQPLPRRSR